MERLVHTADAVVAVGVAGVGAGVVGVACDECVDDVRHLVTLGYRKKAKGGRGLG